MFEDAKEIVKIVLPFLEDSGALPIELDVSCMETGDVLTLLPYKGEALINGKTVTKNCSKI